MNIPIPDHQPTAPEMAVPDLEVLRAQLAPVGDARSEELWAHRQTQILKQRIAAYEVRDQAIRIATGSLCRRLMSIDEEERDLLGWRGQIVVRTRTSLGSPLKVYHRATGACGWSSGRYEELFEAEAKARGLRRCSACWS